MSTSTTTVETLESLQEALAPLEILRNDQAELGTWIHDSFAALEKLHEELTQWQSELARKETELDLRQDALGKKKSSENGLDNEVSQLQEQLQAAKEELRQLEGENTEQLQELERLEARCGELDAAQEAAQSKLVDLQAALDAERTRSATDSQDWKEEFRALRSELEQYSLQIAEQLDKLVGNTHTGQEGHTPLSAGAAHAKSAELRRRAQSRREAKQRKDR